MRVKVMTMDMFSPYYQLAKQLFPHAQIVLDRFHIIQHLSRAMNRVRIQIMNPFDRKSQEYRALKRYWNSSSRTAASSAISVFTDQLFGRI